MAAKAGPAEHMWPSKKHCNVPWYQGYATGPRICVRMGACLHRDIGMKPSRCSPGQALAHAQGQGQNKLTAVLLKPSGKHTAM